MQNKAKGEHLDSVNPNGAVTKGRFIFERSYPPPEKNFPLSGDIFCFISLCVSDICHYMGVKQNNIFMCNRIISLCNI